MIINDDSTNEMNLDMNIDMNNNMNKDIYGIKIHDKTKQKSSDNNSNIDKNAKPEEVKYEKELGFLTNAKKHFKMNFSYYAIFLVSVIILGILDKNIYVALLTFLVLHFWSYFSHKITHNFPSFMIFHDYHHNSEINKEWYSILIETLTNLITRSGGILIFFNLLIQKYYGYQILNNYVVLLYALLYTSVHMINFHNMNMPTHVNHHTDLSKNIGPDLIDMLFGSKLEGDDIEDLNHSSINILIITVLVILSKNTKFDIVKYIVKLMKSMKL